MRFAFGNLNVLDIPENLFVTDLNVLDIIWVLNESNIPETCLRRMGRQCCGRDSREEPPPTQAKVH